MRRVGVQLALGLAALGAFLAVLEWSEGRRERRHAVRPQAVAAQLLRLARLTSSDVVYDLECGDGEVVIEAAALYGARASCFDIYPRRLAEARDRARRAGVEHLIRFREQHWDIVDVSPATVVVVWLTNPTGRASNYKLRGQLTRALAPGARIVAYRPDLGDWEPVAVAPVSVAPREPIQAVKLWVTDGVERPWLE